ncbi:aminotransferase class I/II-fold pyridoxal phosphate-dependent enzyme [Limnohabitans sp.]|uniref:aminotransferase class I/II-fold pyridoxal phosphate-dependent enzyme n=1 Tax=Limnohabitans sp. TaxID=1907725 RepID=UPI0025F61FE1|nr:aminotransferase class I/II-fold pyridoxal phosphate-dependent enzyme [Limnohabitans sp.]
MKVANAGMGRPDVLAFWFGESDEVTPDIVRQAATDSLQKGETFYSHNLGLPELRQAVSVYMSALHGPIAVDRLAITSGGVNALMLAAQALIDAGDEVACRDALFGPTLTAQALVMGAKSEVRVAAPGGRPVAARHGGAQSRHHARHADADRQLAQQPHGLDTQPR